MEWCLTYFVVWFVCIYVYVKLFRFALFVIRLWDVYKGTVYAYPTWLYVLALCTAAFFLVISCIGFATSMKAGVTDNDQCIVSFTQNWPIFVAGSSAAIQSGLLMYLFVKVKSID